MTFRSPPPTAPATRSSCSARGPARTASAARRSWPARPSAAPSESGNGHLAKRPSVQVGDPFLEKLLIECCLELYRDGLVTGIQDLGAAGVACATTELAAAGTGGMRVRLDAVPLRDPALGPPEILMSESQERMMAVVEPADVPRFLAVCAKWDVQATVIGEVTGTRPPRDDLARRDGRGHPARHGRRRGPGVLPPAGPARNGRTSWPPAIPVRCRGRPGRAGCGPRCCPCSGRPASPTRRGSPSSTTATCAATRCWPCPRTAA